MTNLNDKAIDIKGKQYVLVSDRVLYFNEEYNNGSIETELLSTPNDKVVCIKAIITPDCDKPNRRFTGYAQEVWGEGFINKTSALENAETSAVGRALGMMGIGVIDSIASVDEITKATNRSKEPKGVDEIFGNEEEKPRFNDKEFEKLKKNKDKYTYDEAVQGIEKNFRVSEAMFTKIRELYNGSDTK